MVEEVKTCSKYCDGCVYRGTINGGSGGFAYIYCAHIFLTGKRRPCPAGDGCTAKATVRVYRKKPRTQVQIDREKERNRRKAHAYYTRHREEILRREKERRAAKCGC